MRPLRPAAALSAAITLLCAGPAVASTYHVSPAGSDTASGSASAPWATIQKAVDSITTGDVVLVAPGTYASFTDTRLHGTGARITAGDTTNPPVIHGGELAGVSNLTFDHVTFDRKVTLRSHPSNPSKFAHGIAIKDSTMTETSGATCLSIREGSYDVTVQNNRIHDCYDGVIIPGGVAGTTLRAANVQILGNVIEHMKSDGLQLANMNDSVIDGNTIRDAKDPAGAIHNDGIQFVGNNLRNRITNNTISGAGRLLFTQPSIGRIDGLVATGNVLFGSRAYAVQLEGTTNVTFANNTVWKSTYGGLFFRDGTTGVWSHNIVDAYVAGGGTVTDAGFNLAFSWSNEGTPALTDLVGVDPLFADLANDDYRLLTGSPALTVQAGALLTPVTAPAPTGYAATILGTVGLGSYWRLGETSGTLVTDETGRIAGSRGSSVVAGAAGALAGDSDTAMRFPGGAAATSGSIALGDNYDFAGTAPFTAEAWVNPSTLDATARRIFSKRGSSGGGWDLFLSSGNLGFQRVDSAGVADSVGAAPLPTNSWSYVAAVYDGAKMSLYVNGQLVTGILGTTNPATSTRALPNTSNVLRIGSRSDGFGPLAGVVDEASISTRALTATELTARYAAGTTAQAVATATTGTGSTSATSLQSTLTSPARKKKK